MSQVKSIKCTNCAAPLDLLGGGRVESITCSYCKSVLDLNDNYKVLSRFKNIKEENRLPFEIGMRGELKGIEYTIIGRVSYVVSIDISHTWSDFLLFSPLYGYAWLTYENGHLIYSRRDRNFPNLEWNEIAYKSIVIVDEKEYEPFDTYTAEISHVEGELTWIAKSGDKIKYIELISPPFGMTVENNGEEIEFYKDEYLNPSEVYNAFDIPLEKREKEEGFSPLKPFSRPFFKALSSIALWVMLIIALIFIGLLFDGQGKKILSFTANNTKVEKNPFTISSTKYLTSIRLTSSSSKALNNFNLKLFKNEKLIFSLSQKNAYIFNPKTQKIDKELVSWERRAKEAMVYLNLEERGVYQLSIMPIDMSLKSTLKIEVKEQTSRSNYLIIFFIVISIISLIYPLLTWKHRRKIEYEKEFEHESEGIFNNFDNDMWKYLFWIIFIIILISLDKDY